jgi:hypothetical protein
MLDFFVPLLVPLLTAALTFLFDPSLKVFVRPFLDPFASAVFGEIFNRCILAFYDFDIVPFRIIYKIFALSDKNQFVFSDFIYGKIFLFELQILFEGLD